MGYCSRCSKVDLAAFGGNTSLQSHILPSKSYLWSHALPGRKILQQTCFLMVRRPNAFDYFAIIFFSIWGICQDEESQNRKSHALENSYLVHCGYHVHNTYKTDAQRCPYCTDQEKVKDKERFVLLFLFIKGWPLLCSPCTLSVMNEEKVSGMHNCKLIWDINLSSFHSK